MLCRSVFLFGGAASRKKTTSSVVRVVKSNVNKQTKSKSAKGSTKASTSKTVSDDDYSAENSGGLTRPEYMSAQREKEVLQLAVRMQGRDLSGEVPVASFAYEIIKKHPSVRSMGLRERMDFLCKRWDKLSEKEKLVYLNDPLKGLL